VTNATAIEWTDLSWNPVHGCSIVSSECANCYAAALSRRYRHTRAPWIPANAAQNVLVKPHKLREPLSGARVWRGLGAAAAAAGKTDGKLVFVNSMSDLFHERVPDEFIAEVFGVMAEADRHTFQILTKRPERMREWTRAHQPDPLANVWLGVSIELRHFVGRADALRETPATVRFISAEPLLGPLLPRPGVFAPGVHERWPDADRLAPALSLIGIDWLITGAESGRDARPVQEWWIRDLRDSCIAAGTAFFYKQAADNGRKLSTPMLDGRRWTEFPDHAMTSTAPFRRENARAASAGARG
jgi:protein gp37